MNSNSTGKTVVVVGLGNTGSQLLPLLAHAAEIRRIVLVDPDRYESGNIPGQNICAADVGLLKVEAMAQRCAVIRKDLEVVTFAQPVEKVAFRNLCADVLVACVDSRRARQSINCIAWRLERPWVDGAVQAEGMLARVAVYLPGPRLPCMECRWDQDDYNLLEPIYACQGEAVISGATTGAPVELGSLVAAYQVMALRRLLAGEKNFAGRELFVNAAQHTLHSARFNFNATCRFDHRSLRMNESVCLSEERA